MNNRVRIACRVMLAALLVIVLPALGVAEPPLWGKLTPGPHAVGFTSSWQLDYSRRYAMTFDDKTTYAPGKAPRPILINRWYPAKKVGESRPMPHRDYLKIRSSDAALTPFSTRLAAYNLDVIAREVMRKPMAELSDREQRLLDAFLDTPTACVRDAAPAAGSFPLVIYHSGAGSSFEDNAVFCEFLASYGFVVLGSAFQQRSGKSFNTDNQEGSARDLDYLIAHARTMPNVDWRHIGLIGHSAGAQAALPYLARIETAVDAVVSLDTTQDYRGVSDPLWQFTSQVMKNGKEFTTPLLMVAGPNAFFELADTLAGAERRYLTIKGMDHNDYIAQGIVHRDLNIQLRSDDAKQPADELAKDKAALHTARVGYQALCVYILRFFEAELKQDAAAQASIAKQYRDTRLGGDEPHVEYVPRGRTGPDPYPEASAAPPTPRQVRPFLREHGNKKTIAMLRRFQQHSTTHPIFTENFKLFLVSDLLDRGKTEDALAFHEYYKESGLDCGKAFLSFGKSFQKLGRNDWAAGFLRRALLLDPSNIEAAAKLKEVGK